MAQGIVDERSLIPVGYWGKFDFHNVWSLECLIVTEKTEIIFLTILVAINRNQTYFLHKPNV